MSLRTATGGAPTLYSKLRPSTRPNMNSEAAPIRKFTDSPPLRRSMIFGSLQLLFWLFFHPSAWRNYLLALAPDLRPNFCLAELRWRHGRLSFWRFLLMSQIAWPLVVAGTVALGLWLLNLPAQNILLGVIVGVAVGIVASFAASFAGSLIVGQAMGMAIGIVIGLGGVAAFRRCGSVLVVFPCSFRPIWWPAPSLVWRGGWQGGWLLAWPLEPANRDAAAKQPILCRGR